MADVRIYKPSKNVMQSAPNAEDRWIVQYLGSKKYVTDPVMGWTSSSNVKTHMSMSFDTKEEAIAYCEKKNLSYEVSKPAKRKVQIRSYAAKLMQNPDL